MIRRSPMGFKASIAIVGALLYPIHCNALLLSTTPCRASQAGMKNNKADTSGFPASTLCASTSVRRNPAHEAVRRASKVVLMMAESGRENGADVKEKREVRYVALCHSWRWLPCLRGETVVCMLSSASSYVPETVRSQVLAPASRILCRLSSHPSIGRTGNISRTHSPFCERQALPSRQAILTRSSWRAGIDLA